MRINPFKLYFRYARLSIKGMTQYRMWYLWIMTSALHTFWDFFAVLILYRRFGTLGDWSMGHTLFVFALGTISFGLAEWFSRGIDVFPHYVRSGAFDRILLRPRATLLQTMGERFQIDRSGRVVIGLACLAAALNRLDIEWKAAEVLMIPAAVIGGWFLYTGVFLVFATLSFWTVKPLATAYMFTNHTLQYLKIPFRFYNRFLRRTLTFVFPIAAFTYFPVMSVTGTEMPLWAGYTALPAGVLFFLVAASVWRYGVRHYHSTGN